MIEDATTILTPTPTILATTTTPTAPFKNDVPIENSTNEIESVEAALVVDDTYLSTSAL